MATLRDDLLTLAEHADTHLLGVKAGPPDVMPEGLEKINWQRLICIAIPLFNLVAPMYGLPVLPVPAFCTAPIASDV